MKQQLHQSMIGMLYRCGEQFRRRYGARFGHAEKEERSPPGVALLVGSATHRGIELNLQNKIQQGQLLPSTSVADFATDVIKREMEGEVSYSVTEQSNTKRAVADAIDTVAALSVLHATTLAPVLRPVAVERKWVITLENFPYDLAGTIDIEEEGGVIRDTKTAAKSLAQSDADNSEQLSMYSLAMQVCDGVFPTALYLDSLIKTKTPRLITIPTTRTTFHTMRLLRRVERAAEVIEKGVFTPANPADWWCSEKFCGYFKSCKFGGGR